MTNVKNSMASCCISELSFQSLCMLSPAEKLTTGRPSEGPDGSPPSVATTLHITHGVVTDVAGGPTDLFGGRAVPGKPLVDLLDEAEKFGFLPGGTAASINTALAARQSKQLLSLADGRSIMVATEFAAADDMTLHFVDVSFAVQMTLSQQRDVLTGLPNRVELLRRLNEHLASPASLPQTAVLYVDLDRFKMVNDTLGHPIGDALLKLVVERMQRLLAPKDVLARLGGDEFVILQAEGEQPHAAEVLASRIIEIVGRTYLLQGHSVQVGASVGIALAATDGKTPEELIKNADLALFKAKSAGRGTFRFFTDAMDREIQERRALEIDLRRAIIMQELSLVYQPQFEIDGNKLVGFESLVRWSTSERGSVSPAQFIPLAEETGIIDQLGEWVLRTACKEAARWPEPLTVSVNLSPVQFKSPKLVSIIVGALSSAGLPPSRLDLEITEGALIENTETVLLMLNQIKAMGIKVSIDDFGTGYSSLSYLQKFPFDKIKIDQSFIRSLETNADSAAIVRAVTALGKSLGMMTIAEGVETESQLELIARDGCAQVQGYLTGRPLAADAAAELISTRT
ncbi:diguanylate cyclase (plasmid) [Neorhizobium sp. SOG26]|nr:diguanylate cyclase [Neorhizobium sp. SOG26]